MPPLDPLFLDLQHALVGEYSLERELGRGGMGVVYLARDVLLDRLIAIKVLPRELALRDEIRQRFLREARTAAQLSHPNIVPIHRVGEAGGLPYFVMTFVDGETLGERLRRRGPVRPADMSAILRDVAQALGYAHGRGVIHRDIKPDNILLERDSGRAMVTDFGIASRVEDQSSTADALMGTAHFMSPEQMRGEPLDGRSDIYSLGVVAFLSLSGTLPHTASSVTSLMLQRIGAPATRLDAVARDVPAPVARAVDRCLERDRGDRFADAESLAAAVNPAPAAAKATLPAALRSWAQRSPMIGTVALGASILTVLGLDQNYRNRLLDLVFLSLPLVATSVFELRKAFRVLAAGYSVADLRFALRTARAERLEELTLESGEREPAWARTLRWVTLGAFVAFVSAMGIVTVRGMIRFHPSTYIGATNAIRALLLLRAVAKGSLLIGVPGSVTLAALGVSIVPPRFQRRSTGLLRGWVWNGAVGQWLANRLTPRHRAIAGTEFRPTEMVLGLAADDLFAALPTSYRESLAELPEIVQRLTARAATLRDRSTRLAPHTDATLAAPVREQLAETVTALEQIRMDLLRLHGGLVDLRPLTTTLDAASRIGSDIGRLHAAQRELGAGRRRTPLPLELHTPTPT